MRKIALVIEHWGFGGTESYVKGLVRELLNNHYIVYLVLLRNGAEKNIDFLSKEYVQVVDVRDVRCFLHSKSISVVSLHLYSRLLKIVLRLLCSKFSIISTLHMPINSWGVKQRLYWHLAARLSDIVVCVSPYISDQLGLNINKTLTIPGSIDEIFFQNERTTSDSCEIFRIAAVGRLAQEKEWMTLLSAIENLPGHYKELVKIDFYGEGDQKELLKSTIDKSKINAQFFGHLPRNVLVQELSYCSLSVLPSLFEGLGLSAIETMALGIPTITSDFEASNLYISDGINGNQFPIRNHERLSELIAWHIDNPQKSFEMGVNGRNTIRESFTLNSAYRKYVELIDCKVRSS